MHLITRGFVSSFPRYKDDAVVADGVTEEDDPCPAWQNPLHHNNPEMQKILNEGK